MMNSYKGLAEIEKKTNHPKKAYKLLKKAMLLANYLQDYVRASSIFKKLSMKKLDLRHKSGKMPKTKVKKDENRKN